MKHTGLVVIVIYIAVVTIPTQYGWVLSSSVTIRFLECGFSFREGKQLGDHEIVKVFIQQLQYVIMRWCALINFIPFYRDKTLFNPLSHVLVPMKESHSIKHYMLIWYGSVRVNNGFHTSNLTTSIQLPTNSNSLQIVTIHWYY